MSVHIPPRPATPPRILVIGDVMLDRYTWGNVERVSPEAPIPILSADQEEVRPGGAASVATLLRHLDADVTLLGVTGTDPESNILLRILSEHLVNAENVIRVPERPTTCKHRYIGRAAGRHPHQMLRVDREVTTSLDRDIERQLIETVRAQLSDCQAVLISDYAKGACTPLVLAKVIEACREAVVPVLIDPARGVPGEVYRNATLLTPNRHEAGVLAGSTIDDPDVAIGVASELRSELDLTSVIITLDRDGLVMFDTAGPAHLPTTPRDVYDITGAGDMVLAMCGYGAAVGWPLHEAATLANFAAGLEVQRFGVEPIGWAEIAREQSRDSHAKICTIEEAAAFAAVTRQAGKRVVFTNGCFDLFHAGHLRTIEEAAAQGDVLVVAINSDASVRRVKGATRPVVGEQQRAQLIAALAAIDRVVIFDEETPHRLLQAIRPDVLVKGGSSSEIVGREVVEGYGGRIHQTSLVSNLSTSRLIATITSPDSICNMEAQTCD